MKVSTSSGKALKPAGAYAWLVVLACGMLVSGSIGFFTVVIGNFYDPVANDLGVEVSTLAFYATLVYIGQAIGFPLAGRLIPKMNISVHLTIICAIEAAAVAAMAFYTDPVMWYVSGLVVGICMGFNTSIGIAIILTNWFAKRTGFAIGVAWAIGSVVNATMSPVITAVIEAVGWRTGYIVLGVAGGALMCFACVVILSLKPEQKGMLPYGYEAVAGGDSAHTGLVSGVSFRVAVKSPAFIMLVAAMSLIVLTTVTNQLFPTFSVAVGMGAGVGALMQMAAMVCDIAWNPLIGWTCDKFGAAKGILLWTAVTILSFGVLLLGGTSPVLACIGAGLNDSMYAVFGTGIAMLTVAMFGQKDYSKIYSLVPAIGYVVGSMGLPLLTSLYEMTGSYATVWAFCIGCDVAIGALVFFGMRLSRRLPVTEGVEGPSAEKLPEADLEELEPSF